MKTLERLVRTHTAFVNWADMKGCMDTGYVPTLRRTASQGKFGRILEANGCRVFWIN